jgi:hypothetical protein
MSISILEDFFQRSLFTGFLLAQGETYHGFRDFDNTGAFKAADDMTEPEKTAKTAKQG